MVSTITLIIGLILFTRYDVNFCKVYVHYEFDGTTYDGPMVRLLDYFVKHDCRIASMKLIRDNTSLGLTTCRDIIGESFV